MTSSMEVEMPVSGRRQPRMSLHARDDVAAKVLTRGSNAQLKAVARATPERSICE